MDAPSRALPVRTMPSPLLLLLLLAAAPAAHPTPAPHPTPVPELAAPAGAPAIAGAARGAAHAGGAGRACAVDATRPEAPAREVRAARTTAGPADDPEPVPPVEAPRARRVLHLAAGGVLRGASERRRGRWRVRVDGRWLELESGAVRRERLESELLREARGLAEGLGEHDPRRVELARWMAGEGLVEEGLEELERVLEGDPDQPAALELLASGRLGRLRAGPAEGELDVALDVAVRRLCTAGAASGRARREQVILALAALGEDDTAAGSDTAPGPTSPARPTAPAERGARTGRGSVVGEGSTAEQGARPGSVRSGTSEAEPAPADEDLLALLGAELHAASAARRAFAAHALRRLGPGERLEPLLRRCALDPAPAVRREAALALRAAGDEAVVLPLVRALGSSSRVVRVHAAESLGNAGLPAAVPALVNHLTHLAAGSGPGPAPVTAHLVVGRRFAYLQDLDLELAAGAAIADPRVATGTEGVVLDARLGGVSGLTLAREQRAVVEALERLTGARPGSSRDDWGAWYAEHRGRYERAAD